MCRDGALAITYVDNKLEADCDDDICVAQITFLSSSTSPGRNRRLSCLCGGRWDGWWVVGFDVGVVVWKFLVCRWWKVSARVVRGEKVMIIRGYFILCAFRTKSRCIHYYLRGESIIVNSKLYSWNAHCREKVESIFGTSYTRNRNYTCCTMCCTIHKLINSRSIKKISNI